MRPDSLPAVNDPYWTEFCRPLCLFLLEQDRPWVEVSAWGKAKKINGYFLRNALAWLEEKRFAETYLPAGTNSSSYGAWVWRATNLENAEAYAKGGSADEENLPSKTR
jgi:hypothetical protein